MGMRVAFTPIQVHVSSEHELREILPEFEANRDIADSKNSWLPPNGGRRSFRRCGRCHLLGKYSPRLRRQTIFR